VVEATETGVGGRCPCRRQGRLQPIQVRGRGPSCTACPHHRGQRPDSYVDRHRRRHAGGGRGRCAH
jgi:hypothetical protein